jgi:hypothetical protein
MRAFGNKIVEPCFQFRHGIGPGNAERIKPERARLLRQRRLDCFWFAQKSRSA